MNFIIIILVLVVSSVALYTEVYSMLESLSQQHNIDSVLD